MITFKVSGINQDFSWFLCAVHAVCNKVIRRELSCVLASSRSLCHGPWMVCGHFSATRYRSQRA